MPTLVQAASCRHSSLVALALASSARAVEAALATPEPEQKAKPDGMSRDGLERIMRRNGGGRLGSET